MSKRVAGYEIKPEREGGNDDDDDSQSSPVAYRSHPSKKQQNPFASLDIASESAGNNNESERKKHGLNNSFLLYLNEQFTKNPCVNFSGAFERYKMHLNSIVSKVSSGTSMDISPVKQPSVEHKPAVSSLFAGEQKISKETEPISTEKPKFTFPSQTLSQLPSSFSFSAVTSKTVEADMPQQQQALEKAKIPFSFKSPVSDTPEKKPDVIFCFSDGQSNIDKNERPFTPKFEIKSSNSFQQMSDVEQSNNTVKKPEFSFSFSPSAQAVSMETSKSPFKAAIGSPFAAATEQKSEDSMTMAQESEGEDAEVAVEESSFELPSEQESDILQEKPCKLFLCKDKDYLDKGVCVLRIAALKSGKKSIIARMRGTGKLLINSPITNACRVTQIEGKRDLLLLCFDIDGKLARFLVRLKNIEEAESFRAALSNLIPSS